MRDSFDGGGSRARERRRAKALAHLERRRRSHDRNRGRGEPLLGQAAGPAGEGVLTRLLGALPLLRTSRRAQPSTAQTRRRRARSGDRAKPGRREITARGALLGASLAAGALFGGAALTLAFDAVRGTPARLDALHVRGAQLLAAEDIAASAALTPGIELSAIDLPELIARLERHPWIARASARVLASGALVVSVHEHAARAVLLLDDAELAVDAEGRPFARLDATSGPRVPRELPRLTAAKTIAAQIESGVPHPQLARAIALAESLPGVGLASPAEVSIAAAGDPEGLVLRLRGLPARVVLGRGELAPRLQALASVLASNAGEVARATRVDLRFADQVVLRSEPAPEGLAQVAAVRGRATPSDCTASGGPGGAPCGEVGDSH